MPANDAAGASTRPRSPGADDHAGGVADARHAGAAEPGAGGADAQQAGAPGQGVGGQPGVLQPGQVRAMFDRISGIYDLMNSAMTAGLHHRWRRRAVEISGVGPGSRVLDVATGTGDLALELARSVAPDGSVTGSDFSEAMLRRAQAKAQRLPAGLVRFEWGDAMSLPYPDDCFDAATVGFGARNFSDLFRGIAEMARVVRPGGKVVILEITTPQRPPLSLFYGLWFDRIVPLLGRLAGAVTGVGRRGARAVAPTAATGAGTASTAPTAAATASTAAPAAATASTAAPAAATNGIANDAPGSAGGIAAAYSYLPSSVRRFPSPEALAAEMERAGLAEIGWTITAGGIICMHAATVQSSR